FQARLVEEFISWQRSIVREYAMDDRPVTTCVSYDRPGVDDARLFGLLDVTAANVYLRMQDGLDLAHEASNIQSWTTTGVAGLVRQAERAYASRQEPFLVMETGAQTIAGPHRNYPPFPGQLAQVAWLLIARGARLLAYWPWQSLHQGWE